MIAKLIRFLMVASAAFFVAGAALAQNGGTVTNHAFAIGKGAGVTGYGSALCTSAQIAVGQSSADPLCKTITGDATLSAAGALTFATVNSNVGSFGSTTQCVALTVNAKGLITAASAATCAPAVGSITGLGTGVATALGVNVGSSGAFVTFNGALGTPSSGTATNLTGTAASLTAGHVTTNANLTGDVTSVGNATTLTNAPVIAKVLTGYVKGAGTVSATDSILAAIQKIDGNDALKLVIANNLSDVVSKPTSRVNLNIDGATSTGDANYTILSTDRMVYHTALTAARTDTLPAASSVNAGQVLVINDFRGVSSGTFTITLTRAGSDTINGGTSVVAIGSQYSAGIFWSDGASRWTFFPISAGGGGSLTGVTAGQGCVSGTGGQTTITSSGTVNCPTGSSNKLRNSSLTSWFHGSSALTITTAGGWCLEGIYLVPTGASATCARNTNGLTNPLTFYSQLITGAASVTDITVRFVIESLDAAPLAGQQVTCQLPVLNNTGASITPTITIKRANTQDATYTNTDVSAASLQTIANGATGTLAYSWAANASSFNGLSVDIDFGNNFSTTGKSIQIGGGFDCHVTPGVSTGTVSAPPAPEIRHMADDVAWNQRFYEASYDNGTAPGTATRLGFVGGSLNDATTNGSAMVRFLTAKRAIPSVSYWDGAGAASKASRTGGGAFSWTDGDTLDVAPSLISTTGFLYGGGNTGHTNYFFQYTADATLTGG